MRVASELDIDWIGVSHNPEIKKKLFVEKGTVPKLMSFGKAIFTPGQGVGEHVHETMYEVFYITKGKARFIVNGKERNVQKGDCIVIEQGERHSQSNPYDKDVEWIYFGIATD